MRSFLADVIEASVILASCSAITPVTRIPSYAVIIRCIWERGPTQAEALAELARRGLWLTTEQKQQGEVK